jgi:hypothetical protein
MAIHRLNSEKILKTSDKIKNRLEQAGARYWAGDNISQYIKDGERDELVEELATGPEIISRSISKTVKETNS